MSKMYEMILVDASVRGLILDAIGDCFGGDNYKYAQYAMDTNMSLYNKMVEDCIDHYYDMAASEFCDEKCIAADRYLIDMYIRAYLFEHYQAQLLSKIPVTEPAANEGNKEYHRTNEGNTHSDKSDAGNGNYKHKTPMDDANESQKERDQNLRDLGMTDEEIEAWKTHKCHGCKKHNNFNDRLNCMRRTMKAAQTLHEIAKDTDEVFERVFGFKPDDNFEEFVRHILGI